MESSVFLLNRAFFLALLLLFFVIGERAFLKRDLKVIDSRLTKMVKSPQLDLAKKDQRYLKNSPERLLKTMKNKEKQVEQEVSSIMSATATNNLAPLATLSKTLTPNKAISLQSISIEDSKVIATFRADNPTEMEKFAEYLQTLGLPNQEVKHKKGGVKTTLIFNNI